MKTMKHAVLKQSKINEIAPFLTIEQFHHGSTISLSRKFPSKKTNKINVTMTETQKVSTLLRNIIVFFSSSLGTGKSSDVFEAILMADVSFSP